MNLHGMHMSDFSCCRYENLVFKIPAQLGPRSINNNQLFHNYYSCFYLKKKKKE